LRREGVEETILLSLIFDLDLFEKQQRVDELVLEESVWFATSRDYISWIRSIRRIRSNELAIEWRKGLWNLKKGRKSSVNEWR